MAQTLKESANDDLPSTVAGANTLRMSRPKNAAAKKTRRDGITPHEFFEVSFQQKLFFWDSACDLTGFTKAISGDLQTKDM